MENNLSQIGTATYPLTQEIASKLRYTDPALEFIETDISMTDLVRKWRGFKGCSRELLRIRANEEGWVEHRKKFRELLIQAMMNRDLKDMKKMNERHLRSAQILIDKGTEFFATSGFKSDGNAVMGMETGVKIERLVAGEPDSILGIRQMENLSDEELLAEHQKLQIDIKKFLPQNEKK